MLIAKASSLLLGAFAGEILDQIGIEPLRERLRRLVTLRLAERTGNSEAAP